MPAAPATFSPGEKGSLCSPQMASGKVPFPRWAIWSGGHALLPRGEGGRRPDEGGLCSRRQPSRETSRVVGALRAVATKGLEPGRKINRIASETAFGQQDGDFARGSCFAFASGADHRVRETRRQRKARDRAALLGDASIAV